MVLGPVLDLCPNRRASLKRRTRMKAKDDEVVRADLRARLMRLAANTPEQADLLLDRILAGWGFTLAQLAELLPALAVPGLDRDVPLFWLYVTLRIIDRS